ncbi:hypothetical protein TVAG_045280 [Trichomonas vaginalis G3]|uniref:Ubiquitin-like domain-containing protein n=1 Tax=Trichomonas vaginalis (strain ATCC PRA-98 / G3) TaxID=412133 RepID=A2FHG4_TRIV3|nr:hypothetical protein TVAGG3_0895380 [Trichomonas vaginalis G3]EAX95640.1 hypothetical protein TVAG_045280 [Trichomonas vaginalis G3]KAI5503031.1 hypothetical protein TVAGG3_0895380 [Trichomonas vaginalis G3]|eukprot:XP_001308570.1 hypothetical protein [Trichomonas vaginalis G3]
MNIFIHSPAGAVFKLMFEHTDIIGSIENRLNCQDPIICFHNNIILEKHFSFDFYDVKDGDHIYTTSENGRSNLKLCQKLSKSITITNQHDRFSLENSCLRLIDMTFVRAEGSYSANLKLVNWYNNLQKTETTFYQTTPTILPEKSKSPCSDPLPTLW